MISVGNYTNSQVLQRSIAHQVKEISEASERLSSGKRVNSASDDPGVNWDNIKIKCTSWIYIKGSINWSVKLKY